MSTPVDDSLASLVSLMILLSAVLSVVLYLWTAVALAAMFRKMGEQQWKAWVPFLNLATLLRWGGFSPWLVILTVVPIAQIVVLVLVVVSAHRINAGFGYGTGMTVLAALVFVVWASILGFGPARWLGARIAARPASPSRAAPPAEAAPATAGITVSPAPVGDSPFGAVVSGDVVPPASAPSPASSSASTAGVVGVPGRGGEAETPADAGDADAAVFAPPRDPGGAGRSAWTPPDTTPRAAGPAPGAAGGGPVPPPRSAGTADSGEEEWPEIDDVSAIHPSPFPPSSAEGRPYVPPPVSGLSSREGQDGRAVPIASVPGVSPEPDRPRPAAAVTRVPAARADRAASEQPGAASAPRPVARPAVDPAAGGPRAGDPVVGDLADDGPADADPSVVDPAAPPLRSRRRYDADDPEAALELSGEVSAVIGAPRAGAPRPAAGAVPAQHRLFGPDEADDDPGIRRGRPGAGSHAAPAFDAEADADDEVSDQTIIARRNHRATWELVPVAGPPLPLTASVVILGRRPTGDPAHPQAQLVAVPDGARTVSKTHARLELRGEAWVVTDLGSTNGVLVRTLMGDEVEVESGARLDAGERFFLGDEEFHLRRIAH